MAGTGAEWAPEPLRELLVKLGELTRSPGAVESSWKEAKTTIRKIESHPAFEELTAMQAIDFGLVVSLYITERYPHAEMSGHLTRYVTTGRLE